MYIEGGTDNIMNKHEMKPLNHPDEIPNSLSEQELAEFFDTHEITEEFLQHTEEVPQNELPQPRTRAKNVTIRLDIDTLNRLQDLAEKKHKAYQTLLKQFVIERLYEEEKQARR